MEAGLRSPALPSRSGRVATWPIRGHQYASRNRRTSRTLMMLKIRVMVNSSRPTANKAL